MEKKKPKIIAVVGPTSSGKTAFGVKLAKKYQGEIVSADSRQVYIGMDIGTGKDLLEYGNIPYHLIDVISPQKEFDLNCYKKLAEKAIADIISRGKLPIIVGGSGLYLQALIDNYRLSSIKPDLKLRSELEDKTADQLFAILLKTKPQFAKHLNDSERKNKRRLIRYIELAKQGIGAPKKTKETKYDVLILGLDLPTEALWDRIQKRLWHRLQKENLVAEVESLHQFGVSWKKLESFGLEYRHIAWYLQERIDYEQMVEKLFTAIRQFSKRQKTWFRRWEKLGKKIEWINSQKEAEQKIKLFLAK